jgi:hypothetical protein
MIHNPVVAFAVVALRRLWSWSHAAVIALYCSLAWFLVGAEPTIIFRSELVFGIYDGILQTFGLLTCILAVLGHWQQELQPSNREMLRLRLGDAGVIGGLVLGYWLFWVTACVVPMILVAAVQQVLAGVMYLSSAVMVQYACSAIFTGFAMLWILSAIGIYNARRSVPLTLIAVAALLLVVSIIKSFSGGLLFDGLWIEHPSVVGMLIWLLAMASVAVLLYGFQRRLAVLVVSDAFGRGLSVALFEHLGWTLAVFHARLLTMSHALVLALLSGGGLAVILPLLRQHPSFSAMANVYLGALVPLMFALRMNVIVEVDKCAGMMESLHLAHHEYWRIVLHRWFVLVLPVVVSLAVFGILLWLFTPHYSLGNIAYTVMLGVVWQALGLALTLWMPRSGAWQIAFVLIVYIQLREDVQTFVHASALRHFNIVSPLWNSDGASFWQHIVLVVFIAALLGCSFVRLRLRTTTLR